MAFVKFRALLEVDTAAQGGLGHDVATPTTKLLVRARHPTGHRQRYFTALLATDDGAPLHPGDHHHNVTLTFAGRDALDYLSAGAGFEIWQGHQVGHGTITRRIFTWPDAS